MANNKNKRTNPNQVNIDDVQYQPLKERGISKTKKIHLDFTNVPDKPVKDIKHLNRYLIKNKNIKSELIDDDINDDEDLSKDHQFIENMTQLKQDIMKDSIITEVKASVKNELRIEFDSKFKELKKELAINYNNYIVKFKDNYVKEMEEKYENSHEEVSFITSNNSLQSPTPVGLGNIKTSNKNMIRSNLKIDFSKYNLKNRLDELRFKYNITKTELSSALGVNRNTLNSIINGGNISLETAYRVSKIFGVSIEEIFDYTNK
jgi:DNA-binding XRE family transcriptional regulator